MKVRGYVNTLTGLERKKAEFEAMLNSVSGAHTMALLQREIENTVVDITTLENLDLEVRPQIVRIGLVGDLPQIKTGTEHMLAFNYTLSNGELRGFGLEPKATVIISDVDGAYDNTGYITSIEAKEYSQPYDSSFKLTRTVNGFDVFDDAGTQGLHVVEEEELFSIVDTYGEPIGVNFTEEGTVPGDDFRITVIRNQEPLTLTVADVDIAEINGTTLKALKQGNTTLTIEGDNVVNVLNISVVNVLPTPPETPPVTPPVDPNEGGDEGEGGETDPAEPTNPTDPQEPTEPTDPEEPTEPSGGEDEGEPTEPTEGEEGGEEPTEPENSEPVDPTEGENPAETEPTE